MDRKINFLVLILFLILFLLLFFDLGGTYLTNWDEAWYADIARNMVKTGNLLTPIWNSQPFFDKPPLYFWLSALAFKIFGISEFSARFFSTLAGLGTALVLYFLAKLLFNRSVALFSLLVLVSTPGFLYRARTGNLDVLLTFWILFSIFSFYKSDVSQNRWWFILLGLTVGFGFLTKGMIVFLFPALAGFFYLFKRERRPALRRGKPAFWDGILLGIFISVFWVWLSFSVHGWNFINTFFLNQTEKWFPNFPFWQSFSFDYFAFLRSGLKLWFILFIPALLLAIYRWRKTSRQLLVIYFLFLFTVLSFSENKSNWFLVPLYPIASLIVGYGLNEGIRKLPKIFVYLAISMVFLLAVSQGFFYKSDYFVADIAGDEARVALAAKDLTKGEDRLYLTNYYYPTIVFYSQRKVYAVYSDQEKNAWWIKLKSTWPEILKNERVFIITTKEELKNFNTYFPGYKFELLYRSGEKLLLKKV